MNLLASIWGAELGWIVATIIPHYRHIAPDYDEVVIVGNPQYAYLVEDFAHDFIPYSKKTLGDMWFRQRFPTKKAKLPKNIVSQFPDHQYLYPNKAVCMKGNRKYIQYGEEGKGYDIIIHARAEDKYGQDKLNYSPLKYKKILKNLRLDGDFSVCSIGTRAHHIEGTGDKRNIPMKELCTILRNSKVCVGTSSGVSHLAHICGCPIVVLTGNEYQKGIGGTNRKRYKKIWRVWENIPIKMLDKDDWHPPKDVVEKAIRKFAYGRRTHENNTE